jgi:hypothetical protein
MNAPSTCIDTCMEQISVEDNPIHRAVYVWVSEVAIANFDVLLGL